MREEDRWKMEQTDGRRQEGPADGGTEDKIHFKSKALLN